MLRPRRATRWRTPGARPSSRAPYDREGLIAHGLLHDTFETAITWDRFEEFHAGVKAATERAIRDATGKPGHVTCRFTHVYPDGPAPYFTYLAQPAPGAEIEQWRAIKGAASDALIQAGGTITHHHSVGRDHMPWYEAQRPALFGPGARGGEARALDPHEILNPGVLLPPRSAGGGGRLESCPRGYGVSAESPFLVMAGLVPGHPRTDAALGANGCPQRVRA